MWAHWNSDNGIKYECREHSLSMDMREVIQEADGALLPTANFRVKAKRGPQIAPTRRSGMSVVRARRCLPSLDRMSPFLLRALLAKSNPILWILGTWPIGFRIIRIACFGDLPCIFSQATQTSTWKRTQLYTKADQPNDFAPESKRELNPIHFARN